MVATQLLSKGTVVKKPPPKKTTDAKEPITMTSRDIAQVVAFYTITKIHAHLK